MQLYAQLYMYLCNQFNNRHHLPYKYGLWSVEVLSVFSALDVNREVVVHLFEQLETVLKSSFSEPKECVGDPAEADT